MVLPLLPIVSGALGGAFLGGSVLGKKDYTTNNVTDSYNTFEAPYHTYAPVSTYAPTSAYSYVGGTYVLGSGSGKGGSSSLSLSPNVSTSPNILGGSGTESVNSGINGLLNNPNLMTYALIGGGTLVLYALFKKK